MPVGGRGAEVSGRPDGLADDLRALGSTARDVRALGLPGLLLAVVMAAACLAAPTAYVLLQAAVHGAIA